MPSLDLSQLSHINQSRALKWTAAICFTALFTLASPRYFDEAIDRMWVEEAHQAMLTGLVESRNFALEYSVDVGFCAAANSRQCVNKRDSEFNGWLAYYLDKQGAQTAIDFYPFHADFIGLVPSEKYQEKHALGFDRDGFSVQKEVVSFNIYTLSGVTDKTYTIVLEPSGAVQTLINTRKPLPSLQIFADVTSVKNG